MSDTIIPRPIAWPAALQEALRDLLIEFKFRFFGFIIYNLPIRLLNGFPLD